MIEENIFEIIKEEEKEGYSFLTYVRK